MPLTVSELCTWAHLPHNDTNTCQHTHTKHEPFPVCSHSQSRSSISAYALYWCDSVRTVSLDPSLFLASLCFVPNMLLFHTATPYFTRVCGSHFSRATPRSNWCMCIPSHRYLCPTYPPPQWNSLLLFIQPRLCFSLPPSTPPPALITPPLHLVPPF